MPDFVSTLQEYVQRKGLGKQIADLKVALESTRMTDVQRQLLADKKLFSYAVLDALSSGVDPTDTRTFTFRVLEEVDSLDDALAGTIVDTWARTKRLTLDAVTNPPGPTPIRDRLVALLQAEGTPVDASNLDPTLERLYQQVLREGDLPVWVDAYLSSEEALEGRYKDKTINGDVSGSMIKFLLEAEVFPKQGEAGYDPSKIVNDIKSGKYDGLMGPAFQEARQRRRSDDPIDLFRTKGGAADWNFAVDYFDTTEEQGILPDNILRAGAIDYVYWLGDVMGAFRIADAIVLGYGRGQIDLASSGASSKLYRYLKLRDERSSVEERFMLYKRVLNRGDGQVLERVVINEQFPTLWHRLMSEVARFIEKSEQAKDSVDRVSATRIVQAVSDLQYNLTNYSTGLADMQIKEMYSHLTEAFEIARDPEIQDQFASGRRKNVWTVFERVARDEFGIDLNVSALRTVAVEGNRVFTFISTFKPSERLSPFQRINSDVSGTFDRLGLGDLVEACERWIVAANELEGVDFGGGGDKGGPPEDEDETRADAEDDWEA
jgi:hypothetical protein